MTSILSAYEQEESRRALGGIYAMAGFDYQLRCYLAELAESLAGEAGKLDEAGGIFLEALSDLAKRIEGDRLVCIQVKRTLTKETLKDAVAEVEAIDGFLAKHYPSLRGQVKFELIASRGDATLQWGDIPEKHPSRPLINTLIKTDRLLTPRIEPDPWWRAVVAVWKHLEDPYGFLRYALDRALSRAPTAADAQRVRDDICERFAQSRQLRELPAQLLTSADFQSVMPPSRSLEIGREITLARMRDQQYMPRSYRLDALYATLLERKDLSQRDLKSEARVFWLSGRSGVGKSVLLLQTVERLVTEGWRVLWLKGQAELLEPSLRAIADAPPEWRPDFIAIDDLYDPDARTKIDLEGLGKFIDERDRQLWPMILTCGPAEFADSFKEDSAFHGFELHRETVETIAASEAAEIEAWYSERTGQAPKRGAAFSQASKEDNGLFVSLAVELAHGDLHAFAKRFAERVRHNGLNEALLLPLAMNRLYLRAPYDWLSENHREMLATLNGEGDFSLLEPGVDGQIVRLTHPHLADALYRALRKPANALAFTNDLIAVFRRALKERSAGLVSQLLRVFSGRDEALATERLNIVDRAYLARECAKLWASQHEQLELDVDGSADAVTSWACWAASTPGVNEVFDKDLLRSALAGLGSAYKVWAGCWSRLATSYPGRDELFAWAAEHLADPLKISHPTWSLDWEHCLQHDSGRRTIWHEMGLLWLPGHFRRPDWHFVWRKLLPDKRELDWETDPVVVLGFQRVRKEVDGADWAYVFQDLYALAQQHSPQSNELAILARAWLVGREDRAEWAHVWRALLAKGYALPKGMSIAELLHLGVEWLVGREDKAEWSYVWRSLLDWEELLPENTSLDELLRLGVEWMVEREERAEWSFVWRDLLAMRECLSENMQLGELLRLGMKWLAGHKDRAEWSYVFEALLPHEESLPGVIPRGQLLCLAVEWLDGRENRLGWSHVWKNLLVHGESLSQYMPLTDLLGLGVEWLEGRKDRAEWAHVWRNLLVRSEFLPEYVSLTQLLHFGVEWMDGREDRAEWTHVWQNLLAHGEFLPQDMPFGELVRLGAKWLVGREHRVEWNYVWRALLAQSESQSQYLPHGELLSLGAGWLVGRESTKEWGFVCEALLDHRLQSSDFIEQAAAWLEKTETKPEWPLLAAKFIVVIPEHAVSAVFARKLIERINACPNSGHWFKTDKLVRTLITERGLQASVREWLQVLHSRKELPAWSEAFSCLDKCVPVKGRVVAVKSASCSVELEIGLMASWPDSLDGIRRAKGLAHLFFIQRLNPDRDAVQVGLDKPVLSTRKDTESLTIGSIYEGLVTGVKDYGVFVRIENCSGLLHRSKLSANTDVLAHFSLGQSIRVQLSNIRPDGKFELSLPAV